MRVAYLVSANYEEVLRVCTQFLNEREHLAPLFKQRGAELVAVNWRDTSVDWTRFDRILPKAVWDYFEHAREFEAFVDRAVALGLPMVNLAETVRWNLRKTYLRDLADRGLSVGEMRVIPQGSALRIGEWSRLYEDSPSIVAKPSISAGGNSTVRCAPSELASHAELLARVLERSDLILQPFFPEIAESGEFSYFFFDGRFSHAIRKLPKPGDYRAHQLFGGTNAQIHPDEREIAMAAEFVRGSGFPCAYARVDAFKRDGRLVLVELELIEPHLYFENADSGAGARFVDAVLGG